MANTDGLIERLLSTGDVDAAMALCAEAGWNQTAEDWRFMLGHGHGTGLMDRDGRLVATSMVLPYGDRFAWIAMILVSGDWRRRGLATRLMRAAIGLCERHGWIAGLDATEAGRGVYVPLGFRDVYTVSRWQATGPAGTADGGQVRPFTAADLPQVAALDQATFGADRRDLLRHLIGRCPGLALLVEANGKPAGFVCARNGQVATQIGPLVASNADQAQQLLSAVLARCDGPVFLDALDRHHWLSDQLTLAGFQRQRGFVRMLLHRDAPLDDGCCAFINTGPEFA
jgi:ribosomal protein S18 acetylase RimI-like enzyme